MKTSWTIALAAGCLALGAGAGLLAKNAAGPGIDALRGKPPKEAGTTALHAAELLAGKGSWELISVGRVYYLSGDKELGQRLFDRVTSGKPEGSDWQRIGEVYAEAGENAKAQEAFEKILAMSPKDDTGQSEVGAFYIRTGQRDKGEDLTAKALAKNPDDYGHYLRAAEAYLGVKPGR